MQAFIREVGRGKKGARDLTFTEAVDAASSIYDGRATDAQIGAFLLAERIKMESVDELQAFIEECRKRSTRISHGRTEVLDCSGPYDGRAKSFAATIPVSLILAAREVPVVLHAVETLPPKNGVSLLEIVRELGVDTETDADAIRSQLERAGIAFLHTEKFSPPLHRLRKIREELGVRTLINTIEKYLNLADADLAVTGVFHTPALVKTAELLQRAGYRKGMVVQGIDGSEDLPVNRPSTICVVQGGEVEKRIVKPKDYGLDDAHEPVLLSVEEQVNITREILNGVSSSPYGKMVLLNAGLRLWFVEKADTLEEGVEMAKETLESGEALQKLESWRQMAKRSE
jgi:anthranilate phosphoribosyltransferase